MKNNKRKYFLMLTSIIIFLGVALSNVKYAMAANNFTIESGNVTNGSIVVNFDSPISISLEKFSILYTINSKSADYLRMKSIETLDSSNKRFRVNFYEIPQTSEKQQINAYVNYDSAASATEKAFSFTIQETITESMKIISSTNGSTIVEFDSAKSDITINDFTSALRIDGVNKGNISVTNVLYVSGSNRRFELKYEKVATTNYYQKIDIDIRYKNGAVKTSSYTLYASGNTSDANDEADRAYDYSNKEVAPMYIKSIKNGEMVLRFKNELKTMPKLQDFRAECYIDGKYDSKLVFEDIDEDEVRYSTDFTLYFKELDTTEKVQNIVIVLFYKTAYQPVNETFDLIADEIKDGISVTIKEVKEFKTKLAVPTIIIKEESKNSLVESSKSYTEYVRLEAPAGFKWTKKAYVSGKDGLSGATEYDIHYDTVKKEEQSNILVVGLVGIGSNRSKSGSLYLDDLELTSTTSAEFGDVNLRISGAGIPYQRISIGKYVSTESSSETTNNTTTNSGTTNTDSLGSLKPVVPQDKTKFVVQVTNGYPQMNVNSVLTPIDVSPYIQDGRLMLPVSHIAKAFDIKSSDVIWNGVARTVTILDGSNTIILTIGSKIMQINGSPIIMDTPAVIVNEKTFIPMSYLGNALGFLITWDDNSKTATLTTER